MCLLDSLLGGRRRAPEDDEPRPWISRRHLLGFYPIFRIEGAADHLDPEDWIPVACGSGMPLARVPQGSAGTHTTYTIVNGREHHLPIPIGLEKVVHHEIGIPVHDQLELLSRWLGIRTLRLRGDFRSTVSLSARVGSADSHSSFGGFAAKRQGMPTVLSAPVREPQSIFTPGDQIFSNGAVDSGSYYRVSVTDPCGGQLHIAIPVYPWPHSIRTYPTRSRTPTPCPEKSKISGFLVCDFRCFAYLYMESIHQTRRSRQEEGAAMVCTLLRIFDEVDAQLSLPILAVLRDLSLIFAQGSA